MGEPKLGARAVVALALAIVFFFLWREGLLPSDSARALVLLCSVEVLSLPLYAYLLRRAGRSTLQAYLRWTTDLILITLGLHYLGGEQAFAFSFVYCLLILTTSMMGRRRDSFFLASLSTFFYLGMLAIEKDGVFAADEVWDLSMGRFERFFFPLLNVFFFYLTAYFSSIFSEQLRQRSRTLETVNTISLVASSSLDSHEILNRTLDFVLDKLGVEAGLIRIRDVPGEVRGLGKELRKLPRELPENEVHAVDQLVRSLAGERQPVILRDLRSDPKSRHLGFRWLGSLIAAPVMHKGEGVALFALFNRRARLGEAVWRFRREDLHLLVLISQQIAPAIMNARLYANLEEANRNIRRAQDEIVNREKLDALGKMIAGMSHQFRNPLLAIGAAAKRLSKTGQLPEPMCFYLQIIQNETQKLERILKDVPGFQIGSECRRREVDINMLVDRALALVFEDGGGQPGIRLVREYHEMNDPLPSADPDQLEVALYNMFSNSKEAMGEKGILTVKTRLESGTEGRVLWIEVSDTGGGIPAEEVENIFNPFYTTKHWGAGLGLTMTHRIVENHGGTIRVLNHPGEGVTLQISIPDA